MVREGRRMGLSSPIKVIGLKEPKIMRKAKKGASIMRKRNNMVRRWK